MSAPTPLEHLLQELAAASDALASGNAVDAAQCVVRAAAAMEAAEAARLVPTAEVLARGRALHAQCQTLAAALQKLLTEEASRSAASSKAHDAYRRASGG